MNENKLKPCPFCGTEPYLNKEKFCGVSFYQISCVNEECELWCKTKAKPTKKEVIDIWNRRVNDEQATEL